MKELTKEDKARRYDEVINRMKHYVVDEYGCSRIKVADVFPELKESNDERIRKSLIELFKDMEWDDSILHDYNMDKDKTIAWLEKQGERKPADKIQIGKEYKCIASPRYSAFMTGKIYKPEDKFLCNFMNFCSDCFEPIEDSEQIDLTSNTDKVETKFKVGDWVVTSYGEVSQVISVDKDCDGYTLDNDNYFSGSWCENYHLWTIDDAKPGDIIYAESKYYIEQCDNGIVIADNTDAENKVVEVALDDDMVSKLGRMLWEEILNTTNAELKNAADIEINITPREGKL